MVYRVYDKENKEYLEPYTFAMDGTGDILLLNETHDNFSYSRNPESFRVDMLTGKKDINEKDCFERDIIKGNGLYYVFYNSDKAKFQACLIKSVGSFNHLDELICFDLPDKFEILFGREEKEWRDSLSLKTVINLLKG